MAFSLYEAAGDGMVNLEQIVAAISTRSHGFRHVLKMSACDRQMVLVYWLCKYSTLDLMRPSSQLWRV
jgi:hypothetical protein